MTSKSERLRHRLETLQTQLAEAEQHEKEQAKKRASRSLRRAAHRSGLIALLTSSKGISVQHLENEFRAVAERLRAADDGGDHGGCDQPEPASTVSDAAASAVQNPDCDRLGTPGVGE